MICGWFPPPAMRLSQADPALKPRWSFRIARIFEQVLDRAALHAGIGRQGQWAGIALVVAVVLRIGVNEHAGRATLLGDVDLDARKLAP